MRILRDNWSILSVGKEERGQRIFLSIFDKNPLIKGLFPFKDLEGQELMDDPNFIAHASRFMGTLEVVMQNLDQYKEEVSPRLVSLGRTHTTFSGFKPGYFNHFEEAMLDVFRQDLGPMLFDAKSIEAWRVVFRFIMMELKRGYTFSLRDKAKRKEQSANSFVTNNKTHKQR